jgi:hypothetical protein
VVRSLGAAVDVHRALELVWVFDADGGGSRLTLFLDAPHAGPSDHDVAATLDAIRMLVESQV